MGNSSAVFECTIDTYETIDESQRCFAERNKTVSESYQPNKVSYRKRRSSSCQRLGLGESMITKG